MQLLCNEALYQAWCRRQLVLQQLHSEIPVLAGRPPFAILGHIWTDCSNVIILTCRKHASQVELRHWNIDWHCMLQREATASADIHVLLRASDIAHSHSQCNSHYG